MSPEPFRPSKRVSIWTADDVDGFLVTRECAVGCGEPLRPGQRVMHLPSRTASKVNCDAYAHVACVQMTIDTYDECRPNERHVAEQMEAVRRQYVGA